MKYFPFNNGPHISVTESTLTTAVFNIPAFSVGEYGNVDRNHSSLFNTAECGIRTPASK